MIFIQANTCIGLCSILFNRRNTIDLNSPIKIDFQTALWKFNIIIIIVVMVIVIVIAIVIVIVIVFIIIKHLRFYKKPFQEAWD